MAVARREGRRREEVARSVRWRNVERDVVVVAVGSVVFATVRGASQSSEKEEEEWEWCAPIVVGVGVLIVEVVPVEGGSTNDEMEEGDRDVSIRYTMHRWPEENIMIEQDR